MSDRAGQMHRRGVDGDDFVTRQHQRGAIDKILEIGIRYAEQCGLGLSLLLHTDQLGMRKMLRKQRQRHRAGIIAQMLVAHRPGDADCVPISIDTPAPFLD